MSKRSEQRGSQRKRHLEFVLYETESVRGEGHLANASERGVFIRTEDLPKVGEAVRMELRGEGAALVLSGEVRWTSVDAVDGLSPGFGVCLTSAPGSLEALLRIRGPAR